MRPNSYIEVVEPFRNNYRYCFRSLAKELQQIERIFSEIETLLCQGDAQCTFCRTFILGLSADGYDGRDQNLQVAEGDQVSEESIIDKLDETAAFPERHDRNAGRQRFRDHCRIGIFTRREQQNVGGGEIVTHIRSLPDEVEVAQFPSARHAHHQRGVAGGVC